MKICDALMGKAGYVRLEEAEGRRAAAFLYCFPPDIPLLVPGERIDKYTIERIRKYAADSLQSAALMREGESLLVRVLD